MFDTMTFTKIMGGFCGAFLVFLLGKWAAEEIYHVGGHHGELSTGYLLPFEIVSVHLLVVLIGAAYLARAKRRITPQTEAS